MSHESGNFGGRRHSRNKRYKSWDVFHHFMVNSHENLASSLLRNGSFLMDEKTENGQL